MTAWTTKLAHVADWPAKYAPHVLTASWFIVGLAINMSWTWQFQEIWVGASFNQLLHAIWGVLQVFWFAALSNRRWMFAMIAGLAGFFLGEGYLAQSGERISFVWLRPAYDRVIDDAASGRLPPPEAGREFAHGQRDGLTYIYLPSRPSLVSFEWIEGIPDGGSAIVYDATDAIAARQASWDVDLQGLMNRLVNGNMNGCSRFAEPHYYICGFG